MKGMGTAWSGRLAACALGVRRRRRRLPTVEQQRGLSMGRRLLASLVGIGVRPDLSWTRLPTSRQVSSSVSLAHDGTPPDPDRDSREQPGTPSAPRPSARHRLMNSVPQHLNSEDRQEYERVLDEALSSAPHHPELAAIGRRLNPEQLRTMALGATVLITAAAATEYQHYTKVREELRQPEPSVDPDVGKPAADGARIASPPDESAVEPARAGASAVAAVLMPVVAGTTAVIFLLVGYLLKALDPAPAFADALVTVGWVFGVVTVLAILVAAVGLLLTALRNRPAVVRGLYDEQAEVVRAREAWRAALLERGFLPYFREALATHETDPSAAVPRTPSPSSSTSRLPKIGYVRPGFTSPDDGPGAHHRSGPGFENPLDLADRTQAEGTPHTHSTPDE